MRPKGVKARFRRALVKGSLWTAYNHLDSKHLGIREVSRVQSKAVAFATPRGDSWLSLTDKADRYTNPSAGCFQVYADNDLLVLTYQLQVTPCRST